MYISLNLEFKFSNLNFVLKGNFSIVKSLQMLASFFSKLILFFNLILFFVIFDLIFYLKNQNVNFILNIFFFNNNKLD